jgi:nucleotide-binding universal stress UspA family protein
LTDHTSKIPYKSILCALDDSEEAQGVLRVAVSLASSYEAQLSLVRVVQMPPPTAELDFSPYKKDIMDAADDGLRTLQEKVGSPLAVVEAKVADGVHEESMRRNADLVIIGRGRAQSTLRCGHTFTLSFVNPPVRS